MTVIFILLLCVVLSAVERKGSQTMLYSQYESSIKGILQFVAAEIDVDDLAKCIDTGVKSPKYHDLQALLDKVKERHELHFIYIIVPLNAEPYDNIKNVIAGATQYEYEHEADEIVQLNSLTGDSYSADTAKQYLDAYQSGEMTFFEGKSEWGTDYTGLLPLKDSSGNLVAALCIDEDIAEINARLRNNTIEVVILILALGAFFAGVFFFWTERNITEPIEQLGTSVVEFASKCKNQKDPEALKIDVPIIRTGNEVEVLAHAVLEMSDAIRDYVVNIEYTESELARMSVLVNKDTLTNVRNKNAYGAFVNEKEAKIQNGEAQPFALLLANLYDLDKVIEASGYKKGNLYIQKCCGVICETFSHSPVFRINVDEFAVVLMGQDYQEKTALVNRLQSVYQEMKQNEELPVWERCSAAFGIAEYQPGKTQHFEELFKQADKSMREEKKRLQKH